MSTHAAHDDGTRRERRPAQQIAADGSPPARKPSATPARDSRLVSHLPLVAVLTVAITGIAASLGN